MPLYAIETPKGKLVEGTIDGSISGAFDYLWDDEKHSKKIGDLAINSGVDYITSFDRLARKLGYKAVRVYLTKQNPSPKKRGKPIKIITEYMLPDHS